MAARSTAAFRPSRTVRAVPSPVTGEKAALPAGAAAWSGVSGAAARQAGVQVRHLVQKQPTLEDVFARAVGEKR